MMSVSDDNPIPQTKKLALGAVTLVLWLATVALGFLAFVAFQDILTTGVAFLIARQPDIGVVAARGWITTARNVSTILGGLGWLAIMVGGMEYHFRHVGQRGSWRMFAWTLGIELALIVGGALLV
ncbi:MAG: hypothetical protein K8J31_04205 [Anaerolineae bacterium]|jgi:hypothetical protein|nr:hypothetical protein [Anaerolineae bacterium]